MAEQGRGWRGLSLGPSNKPGLHAFSPAPDGGSTPVAPWKGQAPRGQEPESERPRGTWSPGQGLAPGGPGPCSCSLARCSGIKGGVGLLRTLREDPSTLLATSFLTGPQFPHCREEVASTC